MITESNQDFYNCEANGASTGCQMTSVGFHGWIDWEKLDRLIEQVGSDVDRSHFIPAVDDARAHLELVFHGFLSSEPGRSSIQMFLNESPIEPFDPFQLKLPGSQDFPHCFIRQKLTPRLLPSNSGHCRDLLVSLGF